MCHAFELELWMQAVEQSRRKNELEELKERAQMAASARHPEPEEEAAQPDPVPA